MLTHSDDPFTDMVSKVKVNGSGRLKSGSAATTGEWNQTVKLQVSQK